MFSLPFSFGYTIDNKTTKITTTAAAAGAEENFYICDIQPHSIVWAPAHFDKATNRASNRFRKVAHFSYRWCVCVCVYMRAPAFGHLVCLCIEIGLCTFLMNVTNFMTWPLHLTESYAFFTHCILLCTCQIFGENNCCLANTHTHTMFITRCVCNDLSLIMCWPG